MKEKQHHLALFNLLSKLHFPTIMPLGVSLLGLASPALAIPSTVEHPHDNPNIVNGATTWLTNPREVVPDPDPDNPNNMEHQHRDTHPLNGQLQPGGGGDVTNTVNIGRQLGFGTYAVWDDRNWRFNRMRDRSLEQYAHGFIKQGENTAVRYRFVDAFDHDNNPATPNINRWLTDPIGMNMRNTVNNAYTAWEAAVNGMQLNTNGIPVVRSIDFMEVVANAVAEIDVLLTGGPAFIPSRTQLLFPFQNDFDFEDTLPVGPPPFGADRDGNGIIDNQFDFNHIALHETGHSLGLGHFGRNELINLMLEVAAPLLKHNINAVGIDAGSEDGARDLYTIPVPISQREKAKATIGSKNNPSVTFNSATQTLSFASGVINFADLDAGLSKSLNPLFVGDPLLGATINISDLTYQGVTSNGLHYFNPGVLTIAKDNQLLLEEQFDIYFLDSSLEDNQPFVDSFTILLTPSINNTIGSTLLDQLNDIAYGGTGSFLDFFFQTPNADLVALTNGFTQDATLDATYYIGPNGTSTNKSVPEPSTIFGLATVLGLGTLFNRKGSKNQKQANTKE